jgi:hypothetical protein
MIFKKTIAIVTRVMDRLAHLEQSLTTWLKIPQIDSITITDWSSKEDILFFVNSLNDFRITVLQVPNKTTFERSKAHNVGIRYTQADVIFLLDCDVKIIDALMFDKICIPKPHEFYNSLNIPSELSLVGNCIFWREQWKKVNGFNEQLVDYGHEDIDFYEKLKKANFIEKRVLTIDMLSHICHSNELRCQNHKEHNIIECISRNTEICKLNNLKEELEQQLCVEYRNGKTNHIIV